MIVPGSIFPDFKTLACVSIEQDKEFKEVASTDYAGKWLVLYTYPKDFTFVCPTEIAEFDHKLDAFKQRGAVVLGGSTDNEYSHLAWRKDNDQLRELRHPMLFVSPAMATAWGILHPTAGVALRATLIVDPDRIVRFATVNDLDVGRNVDEVLRVLDGLQTGELVACGWKRGDKTLTQQMNA
ncbi:MAG TPA: peroxiredoxin [Polyangiaceae bacterium]|jgi:peroxiredoxin (alkyl hydroperoxide reductase subunit C)|nr:peroxiredoxin [Polyangiaceae bacterium]